MDEEDDSLEDKDIDPGNNERQNTSFKSFSLLNSLSDLLMLPKDMLLSESIRNEVCQWYCWTFLPVVSNLLLISSLTLFRIFFCFWRYAPCLVHNLSRRFLTVLSQMSFALILFLQLFLKLWTQRLDIQICTYFFWVHNFFWTYSISYIPICIQQQQQ